MNQVEIRVATVADLPYLMALENDSFIAPWGEKEVIYELCENPYSVFLVATINDLIVGFINYWHTFDSATVCQIAVNKNYRKQGIAFLLMKELLNDCFAERIKEITLEVRENNLPAIKLYEKTGFETVLVKKNYYSNGENALYMIRKVDLVNGNNFSN